MASSSASASLGKRKRETINAECPEALQVPENLPRENRVLIEKVWALGHYPQDLNAKSRANASEARKAEARLRKQLTRRRSSGSMAIETASYLDMLQATSGSWPRELSKVSEPVSCDFVMPENLPVREASLIDAVLTLGYFRESSMRSSEKQHRAKELLKAI